MGNGHSNLAGADVSPADATRVWKGIILIRLIVGLVFFSEGVQKFLFPEALGVGRFMKIGIPAPEILAPFVGYVEVIFGALIVLGIFTRLSAIPLVIDILVAIFSTKIPMLLEQGFWKAAHESRVDFSMLFGLLFLIIAGGGTWSVDHWFARMRRRGQSPKSEGEEGQAVE